MQAYEFVTKPENGIISIPEEFRDKITKNVKVIIFETQPNRVDFSQTSTGQKSDLLLPPTLDTSKWRFSREEANER